MLKNVDIAKTNRALNRKVKARIKDGDLKGVIVEYIDPQRVYFPECDDFITETQLDWEKALEIFGRDFMEEVFNKGSVTARIYPV